YGNGIGGGIYFQVAVAKAGIAQAKPKRIQQSFYSGMLAFVGLRAGFAGEIIRKLSNRFGPGQRELGTGIVIAEQYIGYSSAPFDAGITCIDNAVYVFIDPVNAHGLGAEQHYHHGFAGGPDGLYQIQLMTGQVKRGTAFVLAGSLGIAA